MTKHILVVEDQEDNRQILRDLLTSAGYEMTEAVNGEEALAEVAKRRDQPVRLRSRSAKDWREAILAEAEKERATLIVLGASVRPSEALLFGETANHLLEESRVSLLFVAS